MRWKPLEDEEVYQAVLEHRRLGFDVWRSGKLHLVRGQSLDDQELVALAEKRRRRKPVQLEMFS